MRVMLIADAPFARREQALLRRLETGLAAEGIRIVRAVPRHCLSALPPSVATPVIPFDSSPFTLLRRRFARDLSTAAAEALDSPTPADSTAAPIDIIHAFGPSAWDIALELGRHTSAAVAIELCSGAMLHRLRTLLSHATDTPRLAILAPDAAIARAAQTELRSAAPGDGASPPAVHITPWGIHAPASLPPRPASAGRALTIAIAAGAAEARAIPPVLDALALLRRNGRELLAFIDADGAERAAVWRHAGPLGLLGAISIIGDLEAHRQPLLQVDLLIHPGACGEHRTLTLDALAAGVAVIAAADPLVECLIDSTTALLIHPGQPWDGPLHTLTTDPQRLGQLTTSALGWVRTNRTVSAHIAAVLSAYNRLAAPQRLPA